MASPSPTSKRAFSKPILEQTLIIHSQNAQYVLQRGHSFMLVVSALYSISVVLRILAEEAEMDQIEDLVSSRIAAVAERLNDEHARLKVLADAEGGVPLPRYTNPREVTLQVSSPALAQYVRLISRLDQTLMLLDGLWFAGVLNNKLRKNLTHDLRRLVYGLGRDLIDLERRGRASVERADQDEALKRADAETETMILATGSLVDGEEDREVTTPTNEAEDGEPERQRVEAD
ncbi:MAG: hypothetical protein VBE63_20185 [Lamprobacter sp.]|uniref:hypothetical protein n=1 Tax=Lamprobacter sp. TaxID=3100796 RepID=UPI002B25AC44|nr:hypothetical protein [Lamprobacter sp.]MEA3642237.1 hypothetical protein [Lamprobacter sp.]